MRLSAWFPPAALSALALCGAATRPHYGGTLRVEMRAAPAAIDPGGPLASPVFETLVRLDASGTPEPVLAISWQHDAAWKRWQFNLRFGVKFHDGSALTPAAAAASIQAAFPDLTVAAASDAVIIRADHPVPNLVLGVAHNGAVFAHDAGGTLIGTGPFLVTAFEAGHRAVFASNPNYWGGRPFLDAIEVQLGRAARDQLADLELGKADVVEIGPTDVRRAAGDGRMVWPSSAVDLVAIVCAPAAAVRQALALSIDRPAMYNVLLQRQGEMSAAMLPQWMSGYSFAFPTASDLARARELVNALPQAARALSLTYDPAARVDRLLADRVAVNAHDAGIAVQVTPQNPRADARLLEVRLDSLDPSRALADLAAALGLPAPGAPASTAALFEAERKLLEDGRVIPLFHLPVMYGVGSRLRVYGATPVTRLGDVRFEDVWIAGSAP